MNLEVHIERIVIDEPLLAVAGRGELGEAFERELTALLLQHGLRPDLFSGTTVTARPIAHTALESLDPGHVGTQVAGAIAGGLTPGGQPMGSTTTTGRGGGV